MEDNIKMEFVKQALGFDGDNGSRLCAVAAGFGVGSVRPSSEGCVNKQDWFHLAGNWITLRAFYEDGDEPSRYMKG